MALSSNVEEASKTIREKGWAFLRVSGKSMFPLIWENDIVFVRHAKMASMVRGDLAAFETNGVLCVHRVLSVIKGDDAEAISLTTKGDGTAEKDNPVFATAFRGKVEFVYRGNREIRVASGWRGYLGKLMALMSPALGWSKLHALRVNTGSMRNEAVSPPHFTIRRSAEDSAD